MGAYRYLLSLDGRKDLYPDSSLYNSRWNYFPMDFISVWNYFLTKSKALSHYLSNWFFCCFMHVFPLPFCSSVILSHPSYMHLYPHASSSSSLSPSSSSSSSFASSAFLLTHPYPHPRRFPRFFYQLLSSFSLSFVSSLLSLSSSSFLFCFLSAVRPHSIIIFLLLLTLHLVIFISFPSSSLLEPKTQMR